MQAVCRGRARRVVCWRTANVIPDSRSIPMNTDLNTRVVAYLRDLQDRIGTGLARTDGGTAFREDIWQRPGGGGGHTRVIENGAVFEKGGVNFSEVFGELSPEFAKQLPGDGPTFTATGVSLVIHP